MTDITMDCQRIVDDGLDELYVAGRLQDEGREAFERHYFGCSACFDRVALLHATRARLAGEAPAPAGRAVPHDGWRDRRWMAAAGVAACLIAAVWLRPGPPQPVADMAPARAERAVAAPAPSLPPFAPPAYRPQTLRGATDDAGAQFRAAMELYSQGRFADAIPGLSRAAAARVDAAFFLAACHLLTGDARHASAAAREAVAFGDTPYLEEARLVLARALAQLGDTGAARVELERVIGMRGERQTEANALLRVIDARR
ncbi:MAG: hypothetical protein U0P30_05235 [Vicinamibacterales bacterium]